MGVMARTDVLRDVGVGFARGAQQRVVGLAHRQEEGRVVASGQLDDVGNQGRGTQAKHMDTCGWEGQGGAGGRPPTLGQGLGQDWGAVQRLTYKAYSAPQEGVEVATTSIDATLGPVQAPSASPQP